MTPLHEAVGSEAAVPEVIRTMIDVIVKANNWSLVDAVDGAGNTALHVAARRGRPDVIPELAALNPKTRNSDGDTPFHLAARAGHPYCIETMLQVVRRHNNWWSYDLLTYIFLVVTNWRQKYGLQLLSGPSGGSNRVCTPYRSLGSYPVEWPLKIYYAT